MTSIDMVQLRTVDATGLRLRLVPDKRQLELPCIQSVMRDYADVADWMGAYYAEHGSSSYDSDEYAYARSLMSALGARIASVLHGAI